ncbi:MAG: hypothetical protein EOP35_11385 [Rubrivivax sp.]|nr:MAG: hypothetical protein EOP35_11385 [Rubrivivax sp.]
MKLIKYRVTNFRSVKDSGEIEAGDVAALIGVNESGKTNLLLPLWKLNPAREGEIQPTSDYPKTMFADIRANPGAYRFISADFDATSLRDKLVALTKLDPSQLEMVTVSRNFDEEYEIAFPQYVPKTTLAASDVKGELTGLIAALERIDALKSEEQLKATICGAVGSLADSVNADWSGEVLEQAIESLKRLLPEQPPASSALRMRVPMSLRKLADSRASPRLVAPTKAMPLMTRLSRYDQDIRQVLAAVRALQSEVRTLKDVPPEDEPKPKPDTDLLTWLSNPAVLLVLGGIGTVVAAFVTLQSNRTLEREKLRSTLIQEASKSADEVTTLKTLKFLVKTELIEDPNCTIAKLTVEDVPYFGPPTPYRPDQLEQTFGVPLKPGTAEVDPVWRDSNLVKVALPKLPNAKNVPDPFYLHKKVAPDFVAALKEIKSRGMEGQILEITSFEPGRVRDPTTGVFKTGIPLRPNVGLSALRAHQKPIAFANITVGTLEQAKIIGKRTRNSAPSFAHVGSFSKERINSGPSFGSSGSLFSVSLATSANFVTAALAWGVGSFDAWGFFAAGFEVFMPKW